MNRANFSFTKEQLKNTGISKEIEEMKKILIAGGTGFVGKQLIDFLVGKGYSIHVLTRKPSANSTENICFFRWDVERQYIDKKAFEGVEILINLTGANIGEKRWTNDRKKEIIDSRIKSINLLYQYISENKFNINTFISSSAVGFYGAVTTEKTFAETSESGNNFLASVCQKWEDAALKFKDLGVRTVILRKGVILGKEGGMVKKLSPLAQLGINVSLGSGEQYLPWIDIRDLLRLYDFFLSNPQLSGIYNAVATEQITMNDFSKVLLKSFGKKSFLPNAPAFVIRLLFGEMAVMLLEGSKVSNDKLKSTGFSFEFDTIEKSL
ncbi:TIGR01777 family oxidoreductase [Myroides odoratimimus]|uniref:TIGR01777 family oxidoreductase n=1 Tax=Myroides odoratimimus TaxID=76832 RepID=UPI0025790422|nr:TIGR01777 family oxidoreductase [Myroides odoratimimus]